MAVTPVTLPSALQTLGPSAAWQAVQLARGLEALLLVISGSTVHCLLDID